MKRLLLDNLKNIPGWRTAERLVVLAVDDYGNVRQDSTTSKQRMSDAGLDMSSRFDGFDTVENRQDLEALFEVLSSVSDGRGRSAVLTPYTLCANPDFDAFNTDEATYRYESLPQTFVGLRNGVSLALIIVIVAEMFIGSEDGLGHRVIDAQMLFEMPDMYAAIFVAGALGYGFNLMFLLIEKRFVHWAGR